MYLTIKHAAMVFAEVEVNVRLVCTTNSGEGINIAGSQGYVAWN